MRRLVLLVPFAFSFGCGDASGDAEGDSAGSDAGGFVDDAVGPSDNVDAVDVVVPQQPRVFRMGAGLPTHRLDLTSSAVAWDLANTDTDVIALWFDLGVPWAELLAGEPLPASVETQIAELEARLTRTRGDVLLVVDPLDVDRTALAPDLLGRQGAASPALDSVATHAAWAAWVAELSTRLGADWVVPLVDPNLFVAGQPEQLDNVVALYDAARRGVQDDAPQTRVFPIWDFATLRETWTDRTLPPSALFEYLDERQDVFATQVVPSDSGTTAAQLVAGDLAFLADVSRRPIAVVGAGYPSAGFVRGDQVFASSEASQYNFLAWLLAEADPLGADLIVWRVLVDPNEVLARPCAEGDATCVALQVANSLEPFRSSGLVGAAGAERSALELWRSYRARPLP